MGKAADAITCANMILAIKSAPNTERRAAENENAEGNPPTNADALTQQSAEQRNKRPTAQREENDDFQNAHTRSVV